MANEKSSGGDKYSKLAGNTIIFAISSFSSKLLTLLVQPFLTYAMAEISDLGLSKILSQYANLLIPFVSMGMSNAIIRFGLDKGNSEKQVFTNGLLTILGGFGILVLCWPIAQFLPDMAQYGLLIYIYVLMSCLRTLCTQFVRSRQWNKRMDTSPLPRPKMYSKPSPFTPMLQSISTSCGAGRVSRATA